MKALRGVLLVLFPILAAGGCRGCFCTNAAKSLGEKPPEDVVLAAARKGVESPKALKTLCGIRVAGLRDLDLALVETHSSEHKVRVSGVAIPSDGGPADDDAGAADEEDDDEDEDASTKPDASTRVAIAPSRAIVTDPTKALVCSGIVLVSVTAVLARDGTRKDWSSSGFSIDSVSTPGVVFEKAKPPTPSSGGGGHHRRRHHH